MPDMSTASRWGMGLFLLGLACFLLAMWLNRPTAWRPLAHSIEDPATAINIDLRPGSEYEITLEFGAALATEAQEQLRAPRSQTIVQGDWSLQCDGRELASGGTSDYSRVLGRPQFMGRLKRLLTRDPFRHDEASYLSFGLAGEYLAERVIGGGEVPDAGSGNCLFDWMPRRVVSSTRLAVRRSNDEWTRHHATTATLALGGLAGAGFGALVLAMQFVLLAIRRRKTSPGPN